MESSEECNEELPFPPNPSNANAHQTQRPAEEDDDINEEAEDGDAEEEDDDDDVVSGEPNQRNLQSPLSRLQEQKFKLATLSRRLSSELVPIRVHDVLIRGNSKTKDWMTEAELKEIENATTVQELIGASEIAIARLQNLGIFDSTKLSLGTGPPELPNTANVIIDVVEAINKVSGEFGVYTKPSERFYFGDDFLTCFHTIA